MLNRSFAHVAEHDHNHDSAAGVVVRSDPSDVRFLQQNQAIAATLDRSTIAVLPEVAGERTVLAHEYAHIAQLRSGLRASREQSERAAEAAGEGRAASTGGAASPPLFKPAEPAKPQPVQTKPKEDPADKEIAAREAALKSMKNLKARQRVDSGTADTVEALIEASSLLRPYIRDKVVQISIGKHFKIYDSAAEFEFNKTKLDGTVAPTEKSDTITYGFYHRKTDSIHLRPDAALGHALHEGVHKYSSVMLQNILGVFVNEGITQMYTDQVLAEHGVSGKVRHAYGPQLEAAGVVAGWFSAEDLAKAYFQGQGVTEIEERVRRELAIEPDERAKLAGRDDGQGLADKIMERKGKASRGRPPAAGKWKVRAWQTIVA